MLLGIDLGTTVLKAGVIEPGTGKLRAFSSQRLKISVDSSGKREQDPTAIDRALRRACSEMERGLGKSWKSIEGIGLATQGGSTIVAHRETGEPLSPLVLWNDARAFTHFAAIAAAKPRAYWRSFSLRDEPGMGLARIEWLRDSSPHLFGSESLYVGVGEWVYHRLTGQWKQDACNAHQIGCYDANRNRLTDRPLQGTKVNLSFFAPLRRGHEVSPLIGRAAKRLGLREGIPVAGPYNDHEAGFLSATGVSKHPLECSLGTAWVGNFQLPEKVRGASPFHLPIPSPTGKGKLVIQPLLTGNVTWDWALEMFLDTNHRKAIVKQERVFAERLLPPQGLAALPWLNRPHPFDSSAHGAACFVGAGPATTREDFLRATAAGLCYELARVFEQVTRKKCVDSVVLCGGASRGSVFRKLLAGLFSPLPVHRVLDEDTMGIRGSLFALTKGPIPAQTVPVEPCGELNRAALSEGFEVYMQTFARLYAAVPAGRAYRISGR